MEPTHRRVAIGYSKTCRSANLVRKMANANATWGSPRIHGELLKLGIKISERTVARLMPKKRNSPSQARHKNPAKLPPAPPYPIKK